MDLRQTNPEACSAQPPTRPVPLETPQLHRRRVHQLLPCSVKARPSPSNQRNPLYSVSLSRRPAADKPQYNLRLKEPSLPSSTVSWNVVRSAHSLRLCRAATLKTFPVCNWAWMTSGERLGNWVHLEPRIPCRMAQLPRRKSMDFFKFSILLGIVV